MVANAMSQVSVTTEVLTHEAWNFTGRRSAVFSTKAMVAATQPLAVQAGLNILKAGGNAADAAVAVRS